YLSGVASAAWWCFGPDVLGQHSHLNQGHASKLWLVSGAAGILGALTCPLARFNGMRQVYWLAQLAMAAQLLLLAALTHYSS
ncbi:MFS transporter, partial [Pantoea dispersa]|nr:MFS transporter [Pantoea dispersa]